MPPWMITMRDHTRIFPTRLWFEIVHYSHCAGTASGKEEDSDLKLRACLISWEKLLNVPDAVWTLERRSLVLILTIICNATVYCPFWMECDRVRQ